MSSYNKLFFNILTLHDTCTFVMHKPCVLIGKHLLIKIILWYNQCSLLIRSIEMFQFKFTSLLLCLLNFCDISK